MRGINEGKNFDPHKTQNVNFTPRRKEVLRLISKGATNAEIAESMSLHRQTVANYITEIQDEAGCLDRYKLIVWAIQNPDAFA